MVMREDECRGVHPENSAKDIRALDRRLTHPPLRECGNAGDIAHRVYCEGEQVLDREIPD
jgi:hypothetical protein